MCRVSIHPKERINRPLPAEMPDFGPIVREDKRPSAPRSQGCRDLVHERVAVDVHDVHALKRFARFGANRKPRRELAQAKLAAQTVAWARDVVNVGVFWKAVARLESHEPHLVAVRDESVMHKLWQERVGRLIGRKVRGHHTDLHAFTHASRNPRKVAPRASRSVRKAKSVSSSR